MQTRADLDARSAFRSALRDHRVVLRSRTPRDEIEDVEIVDEHDLDVAETRQVMRVSAAVESSDDEIDADDVIETTDIAMPHVIASHPEDGWAQDDDEDAYFAPAEPLVRDVDVDADGGRDAVPTRRERRLGWVVGVALTSCVAVLVAAALSQLEGAGRTVSHASSLGGAAAMIARGCAMSALVKPPGPTPVPIDVKELPAARLGTIVAVSSNAVVIDGKRAMGRSVVVGCGKHIVKTPRTVARLVDVPCGGQLTLR